MTEKYKDAWMTDFLWHRHENDDVMENLAYLSLTFILQTVLRQGGAWSGEKEEGVGLLL